MLKLYFSGADGFVTQPETLTSGMVGKEISFSFSEEWQGLSKIAVFTAGHVMRDVVLTESTIVIPAEVLKIPMRYLYVGVYGVSADGSLVIPTIRLKGPFIEAGTDPSGDPALEPVASVWAQVLGAMGSLDSLNTEAKETLVAAINELAEKAQALSAIGDLEQLSTEAKDTLVAAINELAAKPSEGITGEEKTLLLHLLSNAVYHTDVSQAMAQLQALWGDGETHIHSYTAVITTAATCTTAGIKTYTCACGERYTEEIPATGHTYENGVCTVCGAADPDYEVEVTLTGISVTYTGGAVDAGTEMSALTGIAVTATYSDGSTAAVTGYSLSGTIAEGSNTITVSYGGFTDTFTVTGNAVGPVTYTVTNDLTNVTSDNSAAAVTKSTAYTATLTAVDGYELGTVTITMGGVDITSVAYADGVVTIASVTGDVVITASASKIPAETVLLYNWDLTQSLTDTVGGVTATLAGDAAQTESGVTLSSANASCYFGADLLQPGRTIEIDVGDAEFSGGAAHGFLIMNKVNAANGTGAGGITYRYINGQHIWYVYAALNWVTMNETVSDSSFIANKTIKFRSLDSNTFEIYFADTLMATCNTSAIGNHGRALQLGSKTTAFYNITYTGVRIYQEVA